MRKFFKILLYTIGSILLLLAIAIAILQTQWGKDFVRDKTLAFLREKFQSEVYLESLDYHLPKSVAIKGLVVLDRQQDTLLAVRRLKVDMNMLSLLVNKVSVNELLLEGVNAHVYRPVSDTVFNYHFIIAAFGSTDTATTEPPKEEGGSSMRFDVHKVALNDIRIRYDDAAGGTFFAVQLHHLLLRPTGINLEESRFSAKEFLVDGLTSSFVMDTSYLPPPPEDTSASADFQLSIENIHLQHVRYTMMDRQDSLYMDYVVGNLQTDLKHFGLSDELVKVGRLLLENATGTIVMGHPRYVAPEPPEDTAATIDTSSGGWRVLAQNLTINQVNFNMDNNLEPRLSAGIDYAHLGISRFFLNADDIRYSPDTISADLKHLALHEQSGLILMELRSRLLYSTTGARLEDLYLLTPNSLLREQLIVSYPSLEALANEMDQMRLNVNLSDSKVGVNDLLFFLPPDQRQQLLPYRGQSFALTARLKGKMDDLTVKKLYLAGLSGTVVDVSGRLEGLPDADRLFYDLDLKQIKTTLQDIRPFLPDSLQQQVRIPEWMVLTGKIHGGVNEYFPDILFHSPDGDASVQGFLALSESAGNEKYDLQLTTDALNIGKILRQDSVLGKLSLEATAKGTGFDPKQMEARFKANIQSLWAMGYDYRNVSLSGEIARQTAVIQGNAADPNLDFTLQATANLQNTYPSLTANMDINNIDLYALKLSSDTLAVKGLIAADFSSLNPDYPAGTFSWANAQVQLPGASLPLDSIIFTSAPTADSAQHIYLNVSNIFVDSLSGHFPLTQLGDALLAHVNRHYHLTDSLSRRVDAYDLKMKGRLAYHPSLSILLPDLQPFEPISLRAGMDPDTLAIDLDIPRLVYGDNQLDSGVVRIRENPDTFRYFAGLREYRSPSLQLLYPSFRGLIRKDSIYALVNIKDSAFNDQFTVGGALARHSGGDSSYTFFRLFKGLRFDHEIWHVNPQNRIVFEPDGFYIQNLEIQKDNQSLAINSRRPTPESPIDISIKNFRLANITRMISRDTLIADGSLNVTGNVDLSDSLPKMEIAASIKDFQAFDQPVGVIDLQAKNTNGSTYELGLSLTGSGNDVRLKGNYFLQPVNGNDFNLDLTLQPLALKSIQSLTFGAIKESSGLLSGHLAISGTVEQPVIIGKLTTDQLQTTVSQLNAPFKMPSESIVFERNRIVFDRFSILDRSGRRATLDGSIRTRDYRSYFLNLDFNARRWQPLHSTKKDNPEYYGDLVMSADLHIRGNATAPDIEGRITIHDSTNLTYAMLDEGPGIVAHEGIVKFVDGADTTGIVLQDTVDQTIRFSANTQMNVNVAIEKNATFNVLVDPVSGDMLQVQGEAHLNTFLAPDGSIGLTGRYELNDGYYELNYNFLRRKFEIQKGSVITLSGDPLDAEANITAAYEANIAPYDLVEDQANTDQLVYFKQRLPFQVLLKISGKVMKPEISFDIVLPEDKANMVSSDVANLVQAKLAEMRTNPSEMNKQVFAVLILGRFISDDPFNSGNGSEAERLVRQSVSKFLSEQLNQLASGLVPGMELNVGLSSSEDYSTGTKQTRTDLDISASKQLFNNRLKITVGNNFELEGEAARQQTMSGIPGNLSIDYLLTKDGRYIISAYRSNEMHNIVDGYVSETGLNFRFSVEYNKFKNLFINRRKWRKIRAERKAKAQERKEEKRQNSKEQDDKKESTDQKGTARKETENGEDPENN